MSNVTANCSALSAHRRAGGLLAVEMLEAIAACDPELTSIDDQWREKGTPQRDIVAEYLPRLSGREMTAGFTSILTEVMSMYATSGDPNLRWISLLASLPVSEARAAWDARCDDMQ